VAGFTPLQLLPQLLLLPTAAQRTNKSFNARRWCGSRTYEYYLPASCLGLDTPDGSSAQDQARLALLREVLAAYCGYLPYHNFAGNRSQYVGQKDKGEAVAW
jgi:tRNA U38,U39,U40 pseudouridine synthase TruA